MFDGWGTPGYQLLVTACQQGSDHHSEYERTGRLPSLERAIGLFESVLATAHHIDIRAAASNGLGTALWSRYERSGRPADLDAAVDLFRSAIGLFPHERAAMLPAFHANLCGVLQLRWLRTRSEDDLTGALTAARASLAATSDGDPLRASRLNNLGNVLLSVHGQRHDSAALTEAVDVLRRAVGCAAPGTDIHTWVRSNLAETLCHRCATEDYRDVELLHEADRLAREVLHATPRGHPLTPRFRSNLALVLLHRFRAEGHWQGLAEAATLSRRALAATPKGHPNAAERRTTLAEIERAAVLQRLGVDATALSRPGALDALFGGDAEDPVGGGRTGRGPRGPRLRLRFALRGLVRVHERAVLAVPQGHRLHPAVLQLLGGVHALKYAVLGDRAAGAAAAECFRRVAVDPTAPVRDRLHAARRWAMTALDTAGDGAGGAAGDAAGLEPFALAVALLPRAASQQISRAQRERHLAEASGLACDAAASAVRLGRPERALQLLEQGRGVLLGQALDAQTELSGLRAHHPGLADRYVALSTALDRPPGPGFSSAQALLTTATAPLQSEDRYALAKDLEALLDEVRSRPGFADFLRPPQVEDLLSAGSAEQPVVVVNASRLGCHALLLDGGAVRALPLPALEYPDLLRRVRDFHAAVRTAGDPEAPLAEQQAAQGTARATLGWLWEALSLPVLDALGLAAAPAGPHPAAPARPGAGPLPRLWWVPTGPLTALPLHAAGPAGTTAADGVPDGVPDGVLDCVVSSYAPTVRSLIHARRHEGTRDPGRTGGPPRPLVVAMPRTPDATDLPGVDEETTALTARFPGSRVLTGPRATRAAVLAELPRHRWAHFACHAVGAADAVSAGHLLLHDHRTAALTVTDVAQLRLRDARLAYLSTCETHLGPRALADEALHVVGAFHMAGFTHVIGTFWRVDDQISPAVARHFYATDDTPARALHAAIRAQRTRYPVTPTLWAAYLHVGA